jgi:hypothetical protein
MELEKLLREAVSIDSALEQIKNNTKMSYIWIPVKGKENCHFELGGTNFEGKLELKAYITRFENGKYVKYSNGFICSEYSVDEYFIEFSEMRVKTYSNFNLLEFLRNTNFKTYYPKIEDSPYVKETIIHSYELKK